jgi:pyruvate/oxaloacetate carboxyltransferase
MSESLLRSVSRCLNCVDTAVQESALNCYYHHIQDSNEMMVYLMPLVEHKVFQVIQFRKKYSQSALVTCLEMLKIVVQQMPGFDLSKVCNQVLELQHHTNLVIAELS